MSRTDFTTARSRVRNYIPAKQNVVVIEENEDNEEDDGTCVVISRVMKNGDIVESYGIGTRTDENTPTE